MSWQHLGSVLFCVLHLSAYSGQSSRTASNSPSIESLSGGRGQSTSSPPPPSSRGSDVSASSPPPSANKKESFFNITRSRSHSKSMGKKETVSHSPFSFAAFPLSSSVVLTHSPPPWLSAAPLTVAAAVCACSTGRRKTWKRRCPSCRARSTTWRPWANTVPRWWTPTSVSTSGQTCLSKSSPSHSVWKCSRPTKSLNEHGQGPDLLLNGCKVLSARLGATTAVCVRVNRPIWKLGDACFVH